jgi:hypothetical protein
MGLQAGKRSANLRGNNVDPSSFTCAGAKIGLPERE